jgi:hypothetical protein
MAKATTPTPNTDGPKRTVDPIDFTKGVSIILHQTEARNFTEVFTGPGHKARAELAASGLALNSGKTVAVFFTQDKVKVPPKAPQADDLPLSFEDDGFDLPDETTEDAPDETAEDAPDETAEIKKEGRDLVDQSTGEVVKEDEPDDQDTE